MWLEFMQQLAAAFTDNFEERSTVSMGYESNAVQKQTERNKVLDHLANVVLLDKVGMTNLTQANLTLSKQLEKVLEESSWLKEELTQEQHVSKANNTFFIQGPMMFSTAGVMELLHH
eukprot:3591359-Ditylum_brightwellii.AAC.1